MPRKDSPDRLVRKSILPKIARLLRDHKQPAAQAALVELRDWIRAWRPRADSPGGLGR